MCEPFKEDSINTSNLPSPATAHPTFQGLQNWGGARAQWAQRVPQVGYHQPSRIHRLESACISPWDHISSMTSLNLLLEALGCIDSPTYLVRARAADNLHVSQGHFARGGGCGTNEWWLLQTLHSQRPPEVSRRPASVPHPSTLNPSGPVLQTLHFTQVWNSDLEAQNH